MTSMPSAVSRPAAVSSPDSSKCPTVISSWIVWSRITSELAGPRSRRVAAASDQGVHIGPGSLQDESVHQPDDGGGNDQPRQDPAQRVTRRRTDQRVEVCQ